MANYEYPSSGVADDGDGSDERTRTATNRVRMAIAQAIYWVIALAWAGFWLLVTRMHYLQEDWIGVVLSVAIAIAPAAVVALSSVRRFTGRRPLAALVPG